ncbi:chromosomal replication initiator protein DnaA [Streptococcus suis]|nr:chromosomal replication initiator protein DnaA [Streptococcus suis]
MTKEEEFWSIFIELAKENIPKNIYEFYIVGASLAQITDQEVIIQLPKEFKQRYWEKSKNFKELIDAASYEVYGRDFQLGFKILEKLDSPTDTQPAPLKQEVAVTKAVQEKLIPPAIQQGHPDIKSQYTFDNFVQGDNNMLSKAAALAVADNLGGYYNPLFIYGGPGLGKTHLLNAIGNRVLEANPHARVKYVTSETFLSDYVEHNRLEKLKDFENMYRNLDLLLIDDIQTLKNKKATQEEFFNTFNTLHGKNSQIVLTSDRNPKNLDNLEERLVSRFSWGLTNEIYPPDLETRIAILQSKIQDSPYVFPMETLKYIAGSFESNVRDLEGALKDIDLLAKIKNLDEITVEVAAEAIRSRNQSNPRNTVIPIEKIQTEVGNFYGVSLKEIQGAKRVQHIVHARQVAMYLAREMTDNSLPKIGRAFGNRDHTTVMHAYNKIRNMLVDSDNLEIEITNIKNKIR